MHKDTTVTLRNDVEMPIIGFGTWRLEEGQQAYQSVREAMGAGYRLIDTATLYGNEQSIGRAIADCEDVARSDLFVTTKVWNSDQGYDATLRAFDTSRQKLDLDYIDLYLIHWPVAGSRLETWRALERLYMDKKVRAIGISNFMVDHMQELIEHAEIQPMVNQFELHPFNYEQRQDVVQYCHDQEIVVEAYSPIAQAKKFSNPTIAQIAHVHDANAAQIMLRWSLQKGAVPIPRSSNRYHIADNISVFNFELSHEEMTSLDRLNESLVVTMNPETF